MSLAYGYIIKKCIVFAKYCVSLAKLLKKQLNSNEAFAWKVSFISVKFFT